MELVLDHVAIAVPSLATALPLYESLTGSRGSAPERVESQGVEVVFLGSAGARIELLEPLAPDSPVGRFLARRGAGLHHIAYRVPDLDAALRRLDASGFALIDRTARPGAHDRRVAFLHPNSTAGVLIELVESVPQP